MALACRARHLGAPSGLCLQRSLHCRHILEQLPMHMQLLLLLLLLLILVPQARLQ